MKGCQSRASFASITKLATTRKQMGYSQRELAEYSGVSINTISRLERGATARYDTLLLLAQALHVPPTRLCGHARRLTPPTN